MYVVDSWLQAISFIIAGGGIAGISLLSVFSIALSHNRPFQLKIFACQIIRGACIAMLGVLYIFAGHMGKEWLADIAAVLFTAATFTNFLSYWIFARQLLTACEEMVEFFKGRIHTTHHSSSNSAKEWAIISVFFLCTAINGVFLQEYLLNGDGTGDFMLASSILDFLVYMVPMFIVWKS